MVTRHRHRQCLSGLWCAVSAHQYGVGIADEDQVEVASGGHVPARRLVSLPVIMVLALMRLGLSVDTYDFNLFANDGLSTASVLGARTASRLSTKLQIPMRHVSVLHSKAAAKVEYRLTSVYYRGRCTSSHMGNGRNLHWHR